MYKKIAHGSSNKRKLLSLSSESNFSIPNKQPTYSISEVTPPGGCRHSNHNKENFSDTNKVAQGPLFSTPLPAFNRTIETRDIDLISSPDGSEQTTNIRLFIQLTENFIKQFKQLSDSAFQQGYNLLLDEILKNMPYPRDASAPISHRDSIVLLALSSTLRGFKERHTFFSRLSRSHLEAFNNNRVKDNAALLIPKSNKMLGTFLLEQTKDAISNALAQQFEQTHD